MKIMKQEDLHRDTHPLHYNENCYDTIKIMDNYGCDHYNDITNLNYDGNELNDLNDMCPLNKARQNIQPKNP